MSNLEKNNNTNKKFKLYEEDRKKKKDKHWRNKPDKRQK
jgi:hypothetical protein